MVARVLHVFGVMDCGGAETRTMEIYRRIDRSIVQFEFLTLQKQGGYYDAEIASLGGTVYCIDPPSSVGVFKHIRQVISIMKNEGPFHAVHAHTAYHAGLICLAAFFSGVKIRVVHARTAGSAQSFSSTGFARKLYLCIMRVLIFVFATELVACGERAGRFLYGASKMKRGKVKVLRNAIDLNRFDSLPFRNPELRHIFGLGSDTIVIGHVGSLNPVKNHEFLISIAACLKKSKMNFKMFFVGEGKLGSLIKKRVESEELEDVITLLGLRSDVPDLMAMFDILLLPSLYEGLPGVIVEAQAAQTPCIVSDRVTTEVDLGLGFVEFLPIISANEWCKAVIEKGIKQQVDESVVLENLRNKGFTVESSIAMLHTIYKL